MVNGSHPSRRALVWCSAFGRSGLREGNRSNLLAELIRGLIPARNITVRSQHCGPEEHGSAGSPHRLTDRRRSGFVSSSGLIALTGRGADAFESS